MKMVEKSFDKDKIPSWSCPTCKIGKLELSGKIDKNETKASTNDFNEDYWDRSFIKNRFHLKLKCNNKYCKEIVNASGYTSIYEVSDENTQEEYESFYPEYFYPAIELFEISENVPYEVEEQIKTAFKLYWIDDAAFLNALRTTVELILNDKRIRKTDENRKYLTLNERIKLLREKEPIIAEFLMAIKWLGNFGSHGENLYNVDIPESVEIFQLALEKIYGKEKYLTERVKKINEKKGHSY